MGHFGAGIFDSAHTDTTIAWGNKLTYTEQKDFDDGQFGTMWGCAFAGPINCCEYTLQRKAIDDELSLIIGKSFRTIAASMCNYKNDLYVRPKRKPPTGWGSKANPEWHYLVEDWNKLIVICEKVMKVKLDKSRFKIAIMKNQYKINHYCILADGDTLINPDPDLYGPIIKYRSLR